MGGYKVKHLLGCIICCDNKVDKLIMYSVVSCIMVCFVWYHRRESLKYMKILILFKHMLNSCILSMYNLNRTSFVFLQTTIFNI